MKAKDLTKGMAVETSKCVKTVRSSTFIDDRLWRLEFADGEICLCRHDHEYAVSTDAAGQNGPDRREEVAEDVGALSAGGEGRVANGAECSAMRWLSPRQPLNPLP